MSACSIAEQDDAQKCWHFIRDKWQILFVVFGLGVCVQTAYHGICCGNYTLVSWPNPVFICKFHNGLCDCFLSVVLGSLSVKQNT